MKKLFCLIAVLVLSFSLAACGQTDTKEPDGSTAAPQEQTKTLSDFEIGDELPIYPKAPFDYTYVQRLYPEEGGVVETPFPFHIESAKVTLIKKNVIEEDTTISGEFSPFVLKLTVTGKAQATLAGRPISVYFKNGFNSPIASGDVEFDGSFVCEQEFTAVTYATFYFSKIIIDVTI